jgi:hypothetical protein
MFHVIAVIEEETVIEPAIVAQGTVGMFEAAVEFARPRPISQPGRVDRQQEPWSEDRHPSPHE